ncbi:type II toxin-antitoxin system ParD family antitoxin [Corynebacterium aquatimens]|uniref:Antitoxin ParD1/3/4 n=1 Tax=Corynebacterium aquatimens TaxID=1190508 RepID=A0A931E017_9CORY|nr:type II toxin-antitoxin system ParD family antitoxin [Corynebacterium aquatimens]MBG6121808.1 antitoxin ParD1/3/4 [Corynebacterium aquatimens]
MAKNTSVVLGDHFDGFIADQVESGRYATASEVMRAGLRMLEDREKKLENLRRAVQEGVDSGPAEPFDIEEFLESKMESRV